jgi:site-specific DNA-methyltransferase (adenine-specific)
MSNLPDGILNTILCGDCLRLMADFPDACVDAIVTDPPYGIAYHSNHYKDKNPHSPITHDWNFQIGRFLQECARVLVDGGAAYVFCRWDVYPIWAPYIAPAGLKLKSLIVWLKDNWSAGDLEGAFGNQTEFLLFVTKGRHKLRGKRWSNVWEFPRIGHTRLLHPAQKPVELLARAIGASTDDGGLVVDPMCGSGSTGEACRLLGRNFIMADCDPKMVVLSSRRLGLPVPETIVPQETQVAGPYSSETPSLDGYGVHPEDWGALLAQLQGNCIDIARERLKPEPLFAEAM